jgi:hypothetical protein
MGFFWRYVEEIHACFPVKWISTAIEAAVTCRFSIYLDEEQGIANLLVSKQRNLSFRIGSSLSTEGRRTKTVAEA